MGTYRAALLGGLLPIALVSGCGGGGAPAGGGASSGATAPSGGTAPSASGAPRRAPRRAATPFGWLRPSPAPAGWRHARLVAGAVLFFPPSWRAIAGDRGTASAALRDARGRYLGYLNLTPRQGAETLADWAAFRLRHNRAEGDRAVQPQGAARDLRFRGGRGSCVRDAYTTTTGARYIEIACLVRGARASTVVVGAALRESWSAERAAIERAIAALST